ncbi:Uncharacterised protein [Klebsiella pneumoniae]|nr:Uncharacterised protein [Klebsiella pneumoniae]
MFGIYRGRRLALYIALAIIIATLVGYSTYSFVKRWHNNDVNLHPAAINLITNYFRLINMRAKGRR